jgi:NADPH-dependent ferric siderophore reductase
VTDIPPYKLFNTTLARKTALSPSLCRFTFTGPDLAAMATGAPDQRIKIFFPDADGRPSALPNTAQWLATYKAVAPHLRSPMRTYTIRHLRAEAAEVDVDFVLHGETGPATRWALHAKPGDSVQIAAPNAAFAGNPGGYEWSPPQGVGRVLLIGDETALPAVAGIFDELSALDNPPQTEAFLEVPTSGDCIALPSWPGLKLEWLTRDTSEGHPGAGQLMVKAAERVATPNRVASDDEALKDIDIDTEILWEKAIPQSGAFYGWIAGESGAVMAIRKLLIKERGFDRRSLNLMGYWRQGKVLD